MNLNYREGHTLTSLKKKEDEEDVFLLEVVANDGKKTK
jgi:hypothetical protein